MTRNVVYVGIAAAVALVAVFIVRPSDIELIPDSALTPEGSIENESEENPQDATTLEDAVGRMLIVGFRGTAAPEGSYPAQLIQEVRPGAVILFDRDLPAGNTFPRNITGPAQVKSLVTELKSYATYPLIVAVDAEGGRVNRLKSAYGFISVPSHAALGQGSTEATERVSADLASQLAGLGITLNFAPVVDVNTHPQSPAIGALDRSFSAVPSTVSTHAQAFVRSHHARGVHTALKHFPGHGSATGDTHRGVVDVTSTWQPQELEPYATLIQAGYTDPIMTAHVVNRTYSSLPATLSPEILAGLLREELGFTGVIITDDMQMGAIVSQFGLEEAAVRAVEAGADMLIISNNIGTYDPQAPYRVRDAILRAVSEGRLTEERIRASVERIEELAQTP